MPKKEFRSTQQTGETREMQKVQESRKVGTEQQSGETLRVPIAEERLVPDKRMAEQGEVRLHKRVEYVEERAQQPVTRQEVVVERVPVDRPIDQPPEVRTEGEYLIVPVVEERLVVQRQLVLKEELRILRRNVRDVEEVRALLRREAVDVEDETKHGARVVKRPAA